MVDIVKSEAKKKWKYKVIAIVGVVIVGFVLQFIIAFPDFRYNDEIRDINTIKEVIDNSESISAYYNYGHYYFDSDFNCFTIDHHGEFQACNVIITHGANKRGMVVFWLKYGDELVTLWGLNTEFVTSVMRSYDGNEKGPKMDYHSYGTVNFSDDKPGLSVKLSSSFRSCTYQPYYFSGSNCFMIETLSAKKAIKEHLDLLSEIGISENELIVFTKWFVENMTSMETK